MGIALDMRACRGAEQNTASPKPDFDRWAAARSEPVKVHQEKQTGKLMDSPGSHKLMDDIRPGKVKTMVLWRVDRPSMTTKGSQLLRRPAALKVKLVLNQA